MRNWYIKNMKYNWDSKVFGTSFRHLRAVNVLMPLFVIAGLVNLFTEGFPLIDALVFLPFLIGFFVPFFVDAKWEELDWEQKVQVKPIKLTEAQLQEQRVLEARWLNKYKGTDKYVNALRFFAPFIWIVAALIIFWIFGEADPAFPDERFF